MPAALRVRFLRTACPACWLLGVSRLIASRMVFRAQGESPASCARELGLNPAAPMLQHILNQNNSCNHFATVSAESRRLTVGRVPSPQCWPSPVAVLTLTLTLKKTSRHVFLNTGPERAENSLFGSGLAFCKFHNLASILQIPKFCKFLNSPNSFILQIPKFSKFSLPPPPPF